MDYPISIQTRGVILPGTLALPERASGIVLFAHGSGSSRRSPRNRYVAGVLQSHGIATVLFDLLTSDEEVVDQQTAQLRFDIPFLAQRLAGATEVVVEDPHAKGLPVGYFGASTGAAAALVAAAQLRGKIAAVVSRGGRPDLAGESLSAVKVPTLLIVGGNDEEVIELNRLALTNLASEERQLAIVEGATHLFEEPGTLEEVARLAADWFKKYLKHTAGSLGRTAERS